MFCFLLPAGLLALCLLVPPALRAQETTGTISGTVTDGTGSAVPDASVKVLQAATGATRSTSTTPAGVFFFNVLPVGDYTLSVEKTGFTRQQKTGVHLDVNDKLNVNFVLNLGSVSETVTVVADASPLQTETAEVSNLIGSAQTQNLPLNGRDFNQLVDLMPGVAPDNGKVGRGVGLNSDTSVSVNGSQSNSNVFLLDGQYNLDSGGNGNLLVTPSIDSIEEFKILRNNYSAEFGSATGGIINIITKTGGQQFHGSAYDFLRNDALDATDPFLRAGGVPKSKLRYNNFGFSVGGPFWIPGKLNTGKKSDFFFASAEWRREIRGSAFSDNVPSARQRMGILDPACTATPQPCTVLPVDPFEFIVNGGAGALNVPANMIDPNAAAFLARYPMPNAPAASGNNYIVSGNKTTNDHQWLGRWDHNFGSNHTLMGRYIQMKQALIGVNNEVFGPGDNFPNVNTDWSWIGRSAIIKFTSTLSPRLVNDFDFGYSRNFLNHHTGASSDRSISGRQGFTYTELFPETSGSFPTLMNGGTGAGVDVFGSLNNRTPFENHSDNFQLKDDISYIFGRHNLKVGAGSRWNRKTEPANGGDNETAGTVTASNFHDFLLGNFDNYTEEQTQNPVSDRSIDVGIYVQDNWKARPNLTIDAGLRWQYLSPVHSLGKNIANFRPSAYNPALCSVAAISPGGLIDPALCSSLNGIVTPRMPGISGSTLKSHYFDFEPRVGFAWQPDRIKRLVVRSGFGIYHGRDAISETSALGRQPPFDLRPVLTSGTFAALAPYNPNTPQPPLSLQSLDQNYLNPVSYQYSLGFQYELMANTSLEINYVGNHQIHLGRNRNINQLPDAARLNLATTGGAALPVPTVADSARPFLGYNFINVNERAGTSRYNALQVFFSRKMYKGLLVQTAYTWGHNLGNTPNVDTEAQFQPAPDAFHPEREKSRVNQDQTHSFTVDYIYELPFFSRSTGWRKQALGNWQVSGITTFRSGLPVNVCLDQDVAGTGTLGFECQRPDLVSNPILDKSKRTSAHFFDTNAFVVPQLGSFGNAPRNVLRGPGINNWDISVLKTFDLPWFGRRSGWAAAESAKLQFRTDFFNTWNHTQFQATSNGGLNATFQVPLDPITGLPIPGAHIDPSNTSFGRLTQARDPREIQFSLRLEF